MGSIEVLQSLEGVEQLPLVSRIELKLFGTANMRCEASFKVLR